VTVGWYQTASFDSFINATTVQVQYQHQVEIRSSVLLVHDPHRTAAGHLALRAYRLTDRFLEFYHKGQFSQARLALRGSLFSLSLNFSFLALLLSRASSCHCLPRSIFCSLHLANIPLFPCGSYSNAGIMSADVFEEIPMVIHNSHLIHAFLFEMREASSAADAEFELLSIDDHVATTKTFSLMCVFVHPAIGTCLSDDRPLPFILRVFRQLFLYFGVFLPDFASYGY
jgi:translation initiation factor 3 subunit H